MILFISICISFLVWNHSLDDETKRICETINKEKKLVLYSIDSNNNSESDQIKYFNEFITATDIHECLYILDHESSLLKAYAFMGLIYHDSNLLKEVFTNHLNDTSTFMIQIDEYEWEETLIEFMARSLISNVFNGNVQNVSKKEMKKLLKIYKSNSKLVD